ncbi:hypothetical protein [Roseomonas harenae]|uniref:hypothetical protein n=1 Tax=Muricoccus harenae TaxID=2692566 RepID=UPI001331704B|nr:hypothetical protein [Roseomonas harenae]
MMRWTLGLAVLFTLLALVARVLQFGFSLALLVVAGIALVVALVAGLASRLGARSGPPNRVP